MEKLMHCALCLKEKVLRNSHIYPEWIYKPLYDAKRRLEILSVVPEGKTNLSKRGCANISFVTTASKNSVSGRATPGRYSFNPSLRWKSAEKTQCSTSLAWITQNSSYLNCRSYGAPESPACPFLRNASWVRTRRLFVANLMRRILAIPIDMGP